MLYIRFAPDKGFSGIDGANPRSGPVQFEKDEEDPFQVDKLFQDAKLGGKRTEKHDKYVCLLSLSTSSPEFSFRWKVDLSSKTFQTQTFSSHYFIVFYTYCI